MKLEKYENILMKLRINNLDDMPIYKPIKFDDRENLIKENILFNQKKDCLSNIMNEFYNTEEYLDLDMDFDVLRQKKRDTEFEKVFKKIYFKNLTVKTIAEESYQKIQPVK